MSTIAEATPEISPESIEEAAHQLQAAVSGYSGGEGRGISFLTAKNSLAEVAPLIAQEAYEAGHQRMAEAVIAAEKRGVDRGFMEGIEFALSAVQKEIDYAEREIAGCPSKRSVKAVGTNLAMQSRLPVLKSLKQAFKRKLG